MASKNRIRFVWFQRISFLIILLMGGFSAYGQTENISGDSENEFSTVIDWKIFVATDPDSVIVADASKFDEDDYVMLYVVKGFELDLVDGTDEGFKSNVGNYAMFIVESISGDTVIFNASTGFVDPRDLADIGTEEQKNGWLAQLIKVPVYTNAVVNGDLTTTAWDSTSGEGGVLALYIKNKLFINADINMTGKGFAGADPGGDVYESGCYVDAGNEFAQRNYDIAEMDSAGRKGESPVRKNFHQTRGFGRMLTGGGGGNGKYSGGGGGANYFTGGNGAGQSTVCGDYENAIEAEGGYGIGGSLYKNSGDYVNRMFLGGGGGTGTQDLLFPASTGGNGGGIVFIVADTIVGDGIHGIYSDGESVTGVSNGAGGGGGGGGAILLEVNGYENSLILSAIGGDGGSTGNPTDYTGPGGGGGGGVYWVSNDDALLDKDEVSIPKGGSNVSGENAKDGSEAYLKDGLSAPLNGLVYNSLPDDYIVCSDTVPPKIDAATAKGGNGTTPIIRWIQSTDNENWVDAEYERDQEDYVFEAPLTETTYFSRVVHIGALIDSLSHVVTYTVLPKIEDNVIAVDDNLQCEGILPGINLYPSSVLSGANVNSDTIFQWQKWTKHGDTPVAADNDHNKRDYALPVLADTTYYRRVVKSGVCRSVSDTLTINVLDAITNNTITSKDTLCRGQAPELMVGGVPGGGDLTNYWYNWEESGSESSGYSDSDVKDKDYLSPTFTDTRYFKRIVYSGVDSSCVYTSDTFKIEVLDVIGNNLIDEDPIVTICQYDMLPGDGLSPSLPNPTGGDGIYEYTWQLTDDKITWGDSLTTSSNESFNLTEFPGTDTLYARRLVVSGKDAVCQDYSNTITIDIVEAITSNTLTAREETYCYGDKIDGELLGSIAVSADNELGIEWQYRLVNEEWSAAPGNGSDWNYEFAEDLSDTTLFRRLVWSRKTDSVCTDITGELVKINVQAALANNTINQDDIEYICYEQDLVMQGSRIFGMTGGDGTYALQWQEKIGAGSYTDISGETDEDYTEVEFTETKEFRRIVNSGECADTSIVSLIPVRQLPMASMAISTLEDTLICEKEISLFVDITNTESYLWHKVGIIHTPFGSGDTLSVTGPLDRLELNHSPTTDDSTTYFYKLTYLADDRGCEAKGLDASQKVKVYRKPDANILTETIGVCGEVIDIEGSDPKGADIARWIVLDSDIVDFADNTSRNTEMTLDLGVVGYPYDTAQVTVGWEIIAFETGCGDTASTTITYYQLPDSTNLRRDTLEFYLNDRILLSEYEPALDAGVGTWDGENSGALLEEPDVATGFTYEAEHVYTWRVNNGNGVCPEQSDDLLIIQHDLKQYNAFSPNNDSYNQVFVMPGLIHLDFEEGDSFKFTLYNNWGTKVKETILKQAESEIVLIDGEYLEEYVLWDGTLSGSNDLAPDGTYYYTLSYSFGDLKGSKPGYIILRR